MAYSSTITSDYSYSKTHTIMGSPDGALTDYQMKFIVHSGSGTDNGPNVYLNGHSRSWPNDIRFTDNAEVPLNYWIESYDANTATVWVKVDSMPVSPGMATVKLYYGKPDDMGESNGPATFILFDDFSSNTIDSNKWAVTGSPTVYSDNGRKAVEITPGNSIRSKGLSLDQCFISFSVKYLSFSDWHWSGPGGPRLRAAFKDDGTKGYAFSLETNADGTRDNNWWAGTGIIKYPNPSSPDNITVLTRADRQWNTNTWYDVGIWGTNNNFKVDADGTVVAATEANSYKGGINFDTWGTGNDLLITNIAVGKYTPNEPVQEDWSGETQAKMQPAVTYSTAVIPASLHDYAYVKSHTIEGSPDGAQTDYQMKFIIHSGIGTDNGPNVYLNGHSQSWPNDIRFTDNAEVPLNYWIESYDANTAMVWVKVNDIPKSPGTATIYMYYGNANDPGASNGDATFQFFDNFTYDNTSKWTSASNNGGINWPGNGVEIYSNSQVDQYAGLKSVRTFTPNNIAVRWQYEAKYSGAGDSAGAVAGYVKFSNSLSALNDVAPFYAGPYGYSWSGISAMLHMDYPPGIPVLNDDSLMGPYYKSYAISEVALGSPGQSITLSKNGIRVYKSTWSAQNVTNLDLGVEGRDPNNNANLYMLTSWILVRSYTQNEPTHGMWADDAQTTSATTHAMPPAIPTLPATALSSLQGYAYVKSHTIEGSPDGALKDYQVQLVVHRGDGTDNGQNVYLSGHSQSWPNDIRFADNAGSPLSYWIESYDTNAATIWIKVGDIPISPGTTTVNLYYGRPEDAGASSGTATFPFYEDWASYPAGSNIGGQGGWSTRLPGDTGSATIQTDGGVNVLYIGNLTPDHTAITHGFPVTNGQAFRYKAKKLSGSDNLQLDTSDGTFASDGTVMNGYGVAYGGFSQDYTKICKYAGGSESDIARVPDSTGDTNYHTYEWTWSGDSLSASRDGVELASGRDSTWKSGSAVALSTYQSSAYCSYVLVRNYTVNEPTHESWGAETPISPASTMIRPSDYSSVKTHTIQGSPDGALLDYQMKFILHRGSGTDNGQDVYLNGGSQSWPNDIRFTDTDNATLSYWIESYSANMATVWVKVNNVPASPDNAIVKLYYGKPGDQGISNGDATFDFFDDFSAGTIDTTKWSSPTATTKVEESDGMLNIAAGSISPGEITSRNSYTNGVIEARATVSQSSNDCDHIEILARKSGSNEVQCTARGSPVNDFYIYDGAFQAGPVHFEDITAHMNQWHRFVFTLNGNSVKGYVINEDSRVSQTVSGTTPITGAGGIGVGAHKKGDTVQVDFIFLRKYTPNQPTHGTWSETSSSGHTGLNWSTPDIPNLSMVDIAILATIAILTVVILVLVAVLGILVLGASGHK